MSDTFSVNEGQFRLIWDENYLYYIVTSKVKKSPQEVNRYISQRRKKSIEKIIKKLTKENDPSIALLDACAVIPDVLTYYQERRENESYLPTASERESVNRR